MDPVKKQDETDISFEEAMKRLEETVGKLEKGDIPLEKAIELYSEGMKLAGICTARINEIEAKMTILSEKSPGSFSEKDIEEE